MILICDWYNHLIFLFRIEVAKLYICHLFCLNLIFMISFCFGFFITILCVIVFICSVNAKILVFLFQQSEQLYLMVLICGIWLFCDCFREVSGDINYQHLQFVSGQVFILGQILQIFMFIYFFFFFFNISIFHLFSLSFLYIIFFLFR